jgi:hypothetical protein
VLDVAEPALRELLEHLEAAAAAEDAAFAREVLRHEFADLDDADDALADQLRFDMELDDLDAASPGQMVAANDAGAPAPSVAREDAPASRAARLPPSSNTGVSSAAHAPKGGAKPHDPVAPRG